MTLVHRPPNPERLFVSDKKISITVGTYEVCFRDIVIVWFHFLISKSLLLFSLFFFWLFKLFSFFVVNRILHLGFILSLIFS